MKKITAVFILVFLSSCTKQVNYYHPAEVEKSSSANYSRSRLAKPEQKAPETTKEALAKLEDYKDNWLYGQGMGKTLTNLGAIAVFPPFVIYVVGNAGLDLLGYQPLYLTNALPDSSREPVLKAYNGVTSVPGRISAKIAGEEFREAAVYEEK